MYHLKQIPSSSQINKYLRRILFGKNIFCPKCKSREVIRYEKRYRCRRCRLKFSLLSYTWMSNIKIPLSDFWLILWCFTGQMPVKQAMNVCSLSEKGIRHWYDLFRKNLPLNQDVLGHIVQLDEAYFGGWSGFALLMGKQKGTRKLAYQLLPSNRPNKSDARDFVVKFVKPRTMLNTDASVIYQRIDKLLPVKHDFDIHKKFEFTKTSEIEGMFGVLRTFIRRMYHHVTKKRFPEVMSEFYCRFSHPEMFKNPYQYLLNTLVLVPTG